MKVHCTVELKQELTSLYNTPHYILIWENIKLWSEKPTNDFKFWLLAKEPFVKLNYNDD